MNIDVAFTPAEVQALSNKVCIVVDVIRSTSSLAVIMSRKPGKVILTSTVQKATKFASKQSVHPLLCGERGGLPPEGFDFGNSPREYQKANLEGRTLVFTSSNGTRAIGDVSLAPHVLLGSLLNGTAVVEKALELACRVNYDILIVCAGREEKFAIDDAYCSGYLISSLVGSIPPEETFVLGEGGQAALAIYGYYRDPLRLMQNSGAGKSIIEIGLGDDIPFVLEKDTFPTVPHLLKEKETDNPQWGFVTFLSESY